MEQLAPHERVFVDKAFLTDDPMHASLACQDCHGGNPADADWRSALATYSLKRMGYVNALSMDGGWTAWQEAGYPVQ